MKLFLDTNVLVSALMWKGVCFKFLSKALEKNHELLVSPIVLVELTDVLKRDFGLSEEERSDFLAFIFKSCKLVFDKKPSDGRALKRNDAIVLETALGYADVLVTFDKRLLKAGAKILVAKPSEFAF